MATHTSCSVEHSATLRNRLAPLRDASLEKWRAAPPELPRLGPQASRWQQWRNARATRRLIDEIAHRVDEHPGDTTGQSEWRDGLRTMLQDFGERRFGWPDGYRRLLFGDAFYDASVDFARQARTFDPSLRIDDLWQALRNVWIGNNLQMLLGKPVRLTVRASLSVAFGFSRTIRIAMLPWRRCVSRGEAAHSRRSTRQP